MIFANWDKRRHDEKLWVGEYFENFSIELNRRHEDEHWVGVHIWNLSLLASEFIMRSTSKVNLTFKKGHIFSVHFWMVAHALHMASTKTSQFWEKKTLEVQKVADDVQLGVDSQMHDSLSRNVLVARTICAPVIRHHYTIEVWITTPLT